MEKTSTKIEKKAKSYQIKNTQEKTREKVLTAEGYRRAMLKKHKVKG